MTEFWRPGNHVLGAGVAYFDDGAGERPIIETDQFSLNVEAETAERWESIDGPRQVVDSKIVGVRRTIIIGTTDLIRQNLELYFGATRRTALAVGASYSASSTGAGLWYQCTALPQSFTLDSIVFANEAAPVEGTHYNVDLTRGRVEVLEDGLGQLDVTFTASAVDALDIAPQAEVRGGLRFLADPTRGKGIDAWFPAVVLRPAGSLDFKSRTDWSRLGLEIEVLAEPRTSTRTTMALTSTELDL